MAFGLVGLAAIGLGGWALTHRPVTWDPAVEPFVAFVEEHRGLEFDHPVRVRWMTMEEAMASEGSGGEADFSWAEPYQL
ncbi:MAG: hypothetical protein O3C27_08500, partial [Actinomycetota bacterium]|nr:hypothetical protein [Actinomycetota bacterium]